MKLNDTRILGIDYGDIRIGIAISDISKKISSPLEIISRKNNQEYKSVIKRLKEIIKDNSIELIVLGYPIQMNNTEGLNCKKVLEFKSLLEKNISIDIELFDERLTTIMAKKIREINNNKHKAKNDIDKFAASLILEGFLERRIKMEEFDKKDNLDGNDEEITSIIMIDDDGNEISFVLLEKFNFEDNDYFIMIKEDDFENEDESHESEIHIFKQTGESDDDIELEEITEEEFEKIEQIVKEKLNDFEIEG